MTRDANRAIRSKASSPPAPTPAKSRTSCNLSTTPLTCHHDLTCYHAQCPKTGLGHFELGRRRSKVGFGRHRQPTRPSVPKRTDIAPETLRALGYLGVVYLSLYDKLFSSPSRSGLECR